MESTETPEQKQNEAEAGETKPDPAGIVLNDEEETASEVQWCGLESRHGRHVTSAMRGRPLQVCPGLDDTSLDPADDLPADDDPADELGTYVAMFDQYRAEQKHWLGPAQLPLVFHIRKLCAKLDADPDAPASLSSAYLQALHRLERQRPGAKAPAGADGDLPGQASIFDELD